MPRWASSTEEFRANHPDRVAAFIDMGMANLPPGIAAEWNRRDRRHRV
jgi:hypothetical protein